MVKKARKKVKRIRKPKTISVNEELWKVFDEYCKENASVPSRMVEKAGSRVP